MKHRHEPLLRQAAWLQAVVRGYDNDHAIPGNKPALETFHREVLRNWLKALRRRSQRHNLMWKRFGVFANRRIPKPRILHEHANDRFYAKHPR